MFEGFNLSSSCDFDARYKIIGERISSAQKAHVESELTKYVNSDKSIDGSTMENDWFPEIQADIFISHSHADRDQALKLAGWLYEEFGLKVFIDSCVWGYADDLLKKLDNVYCKIENSSSYSYEERNKSTSHVHMMLSTALSKMVDRTECLLFLNTPKSITSAEVFNQTKSPWIYFELKITQLIRKKTLKEYRPEVLLEFADAELKKSLKATLDVNYRVTLDHLIDLDQNDLDKWLEKHKINNIVQNFAYTSRLRNINVPFALDSLYGFKVPQLSKRLGG